MSEHLKRLVAPRAWHIAKKTNTFISKTAPGPHNGQALPIGVWLRDTMGFAQTLKEVKQILNERSVIVNGRPCRDPKMGIGIFDIIVIPKKEKCYRILLAKNGRLVAIEIDAEAAKSRLCKIQDKTIVAGRKTQVNLTYGANVLTEEACSPKDSLVLSLEPEQRLAVIDHFPYKEGNMAMVIGGRHSGKIGKILTIKTVMGSTPNTVILEEVGTGTQFDTIDSYIYMVGRETSALAEWGIEE